MRSDWTDDRLDDRFDRVDAELGAMRDEMRSFRSETNARLERFEGRLDHWLRLMFSAFVALIAALLGAHLS